MSDVTGGTVPLPIALRKGFGRDGQHSATYADVVTGYGATKSEARGDLLDAVRDLVVATSQVPAVVRDDLGQVWFLSPTGSGTLGTVLRPDGTVSVGISISSGTPAERADQMVTAMPGSVRLA